MYIYDLMYILSLSLSLFLSLSLCVCVCMCVCFVKLCNCKNICFKKSMRTGVEITILFKFDLDKFAFIGTSF